LALGALLLAGSASAQEGRPTILREIGWDQRLGETVPGDLVLRDETGKEVGSASWEGRPVVLSLVTRVPHALHADAQQPGQRASASAMTPGATSRS
jgi:hypothetical protein